MNGYLLDTNAALIALTEPTVLRPDVRAAVLAGPNLLSAVVYWEVLLKSMKGTLKVGDPRIWWLDALEQLAAIPVNAPAGTRLRSLSPASHPPGSLRPCADRSGHGRGLTSLHDYQDSQIPKYASRAPAGDSMMAVVPASEGFRAIRSLVLNAVSSPSHRALYNKALEDFLAWWEEQGRPPLSRAAVQAHRAFLEGQRYSASTINQHLAAIRKLAREAAANGLLAPELAAGIMQVPGVKLQGEPEEETG